MLLFKERTRGELKTTLKKIYREAMEQSSSASAPMNLRHVNKLTVIVNRTYTFIHSLALSFLLYYRVSFFFSSSRDTKTPMLAWLIIFAAELALSFQWLLSQAFYWRPVSRTVFPERLPEDDKLPAIDVFICTADPEKEPTVDVMNTVISAMALDYPPEKLHVYLSDDGGADVTLNGMREAWTFAKLWVPFCNKYKIKCRSPKAYFSTVEDESSGHSGDADFIRERQIVERKCEVFEERLREYAKHGDTGISKRRDHPALIEVMGESSMNHAMEEEREAKNMPVLVYISREKMPSHAHHFKAGALNVLLRVSGVISNSPFILGLDCDMFCNDASSARQAMCFHLDPKLSPSIALVQFPQKFQNISKNDIYDSQLRSTFKVLWPGFDGLQGPCVSGTGYYIKRFSLYGKFLKDDYQNDLMKLRQSLGPSNDFIKTVHGNYKPYTRAAVKLAEAQHLASCAYEDGTKWGEEVGYLYASVTEDYFTGFVSLHCKGWNSVYYDPPRPQFLGSGTTNLNDLLVQSTRWTSGLVDVAISKYCPLIYGLFKMSFLECMCYAWIAIFPICYFFSLWCFATIPQLCILNGISLYPEVKNWYFWVFCFTFISYILRHLFENLTTGESLQHWIYEQRIWMMKAVTSQFYGTLDAVMKKFGLREASFYPTNKVDDVEQLKRYNMGVFNFQTCAMFLVPMASLVMLNMVSLCVGIARVIFLGELEKLFIQVFIPFYVVVVNYPIIEGMLIRKENGGIPVTITLLSASTSIFLCVLSSIILM